MRINIKLTILLITLLPFCLSCSSVAKMKRKQKRRQNDTEKMIDARQKEEEKAYHEAVDKHWKNQDKKTKRRMKNTAFQSVDYHDSKSGSFFSRLFKRNKAKRAKRKDLK